MEQDGYIVVSKLQSNNIPIMGLKYDTFILQWRKNGLSGLRDINRVHLATAMVRHLGRLACKAFREGTWHMFGKQWCF